VAERANKSLDLFRQSSLRFDDKKLNQKIYLGGQKSARYPSTQRGKTSNILMTLNMVTM
jgi:hypothetical protein